MPRGISYYVMPTFTRRSTRYRLKATVRLPDRNILIMTSNNVLPLESLRIKLLRLKNLSCNSSGARFCLEEELFTNRPSTCTTPPEL
jgi:hypothetical protein